MTPSAPETNPAIATRESVLKTAILGTSRQSFEAIKSKAEAIQDPASSLIAQLEPSEQEASVLSAAAILVLYGRAGGIAMPAGETRLQPCPADERPHCSAAASTRLAGLLEQSQSPLLAEWLQAAADCAVRVPEEYLPNVLDAGKRQSELRPLINAVLGHRGHWLAAQNPAWSFGEAVSDEQTQSDEIWQVGSKAQRLSFLKYYREHDAAKARELLTMTWTQEPSVERSEFLATFATGLSMADEEFLENALDDKRKEVRQTAAGLLAQLPESCLVARTFERLKSILKISAAGKLKGLLGRGVKIEIELPKEFDKAMARDGVEEKWYGGGKKGQKAGWVQQMLEMVPPESWEREWNLGPRDIISAAGTSEWKEVLLQGFAQSATRHKATAWLETLIEEVDYERHLLDARALSSLPGETLERFVMAHLKTGLLKRSVDSRLTTILQYHQAPWSLEFSRALLNAAREEMKNSDAQQHWLRYSLKSWALWIPPDLYDEAARGWPREKTHWEKWEPVVNEFLHVLQMRRDMRRELYASKPN